MYCSKLLCIINGKVDFRKNILKGDQKHALNGADPLLAHVQTALIMMLIDIISHARTRMVVWHVRTYEVQSTCKPYGRCS